MRRRFRPVSLSVWLPLTLIGGLQAAGAAFERQVTGGRSAGMGGAIVTGSPDVWSATVHGALLVLVDRPAFESQIQPSPFGLSELSRAGIAAVLPLGPGTVALSGMRFGGRLYAETEVVVAAGVRVHPMLLMGARLRWCHLAADRYGSAAAIAVDASLAALPIEGVVLSALIRGLNRPAIGESGEPLPFEMAVGVAYAPPGGVEATVEWNHDVLYEGSLDAGVEYAPAPFLRLRAGVTGAERTWTCGVGLRYRGVACDYGVVLHRVLGPAHTLSVGYSFP